MIDPVSSQISALQNLQVEKGLEQVPLSPAKIGESPGGGFELTPSKEVGSTSFSDVIGGLVRAVDDKSKVADAEVHKLMTGESDSIHRSMIAMQESGMAFSLLVEVRNKLVESYQELMRMPV